MAATNPADVDVVSDATRTMIDLLERLKTVHGPESLRLAQQQLQGLPEELSEDVDDLLALEPGWADTSGDDFIDSSAFDVSAGLLVAFSVAGRLPDVIIPSPKQTINFKFGSDTLIVDGTNKLCLFKTTDDPPSIIRAHASEVLAKMTIALPKPFVSSLERFIEKK